MSYIGNSPGVASQRVETAFTATASQTVFTPSSGYTLGYCDVYYNGVKLVNGDDYTAADGVSITLATAAAAGDSVVVVASFPRGLSDGYLKAEADAKYVALTGDQTVAGVKTFSGSATIVNGNLGVGTSSVLGNSTFNAALGIAVRNQSTSMGYFQTYNANAGSNLKTWRFGGDASGNLVFETVNDAYSSATTRLTLGATGGLTVTNTIALYNNNQIRFYNSNNTNWSVIDCPATDGTGPLRFSVGAGEAARFDNSGRFLLGNISPIGAAKAVIYSQSASGIYKDDASTTSGLTIAGTTDRTRLQLGVGGAGLGYGSWIQSSYDNTGGATGLEPLYINPLGGLIGFGTTNPTTYITVRAPIDSAAYGSGTRMIDFKSYYPGYDTETVKSALVSGVSAQGTLNTQSGYFAIWVASAGTLGEKLRIEHTGAVTIGGSLSKGSGSFRIDHPLPALEATHQLVHSFIEGPQADLIYRGKVNLMNGAAQVNIDEAAGMTDGTFVLLNREVQCFTTNETGWVHVRGSVTGNVLTIEAQDNTCTDTISWMVIGERQDKHMYDTEWTDENGKVIVEPLKEVVPEPEQPVEEAA